MNYSAEEKRMFENDTERYKTNLEVKAKELIMYFFPHKTVQLNKWLEENLPLDSISSCHQFLKENASKSSSKKPNNSSVSKEVASTSQSNTSKTTDVSNDDRLKCNKTFKKVHDFIKQELFTVRTEMNTIRMWVRTLVPKIEGGNNSGVMVQERVMSELKAIEDLNTSCVFDIKNYYMSRAKLVKKALKYPDVEDTQMSVNENDEQHYFWCRRVVNQVRNVYFNMQDFLIKNIDSIENPRSSRADDEGEPNLFYIS